MEKELLHRKEELYKRIELLSRGMKSPMFRGRPLKNFEGIGFGVGPQGKPFWIVNPKTHKPISMVSTPIYQKGIALHERALDSELLPKGSFLRLENGLVLKSLPVDSFQALKMADGSMIADHGMFQMHCYKTLTSSLAYECIHFRNNEPCRYCEIGSIGEDLRGFATQHEIDRYLEGIGLIMAHTKIRTLSITAGTFSENRNEVVERYLTICAQVKERFPDLRIHIQHEPVDDCSIYKEISRVVDTTGIFLEILDENIRKEICPGKAVHSREKYVENYRTAVEYYGRGNVMTTNLIGFGEPLDNILESIEEFAAIGVKTVTVFVRPNNSNLKDHYPTYLDLSTAELVSYFIESARIHLRHGIGFNVGNGAGCVGCGACTAMKEADRVARLMGMNKE